MRDLTAPRDFDDAVADDEADDLNSVVAKVPDVEPTFPIETPRFLTSF